MKIEITNARSCFFVDVGMYPQLKDLVNVEETSDRSFTTKFQSIGEAVEWLLQNVYRELIVKTNGETPCIIIYDYYVE